MASKGLPVQAATPQAVPPALLCILISAEDGRPRCLQLASAQTTALSFTLSLSEQPRARVQLSMSAARGQLIPAEAAFTPANWTTPQLVSPPCPTLEESTFTWGAVVHAHRGHPHSGATAARTTGSTPPAEVRGG